MKIEQVNLYALEVPPTTPLGNSQRQFSAYHYVLAEVMTEHEVGWGWTYTQGVGGVVIHDILRHVLIPSLIGQDPWHLNTIWQRWRNDTYSIGLVGAFRIAAAALDIACWDVAARSIRRPLTDLLGGALRDRVPAYASSVNLNFSLPQLEEEARGVLASGLHHYKMKVGKPTVEEDLERIRTVQEASAHRVAIMVDANQAFQTDEALLRARAYANAGAIFLEEPVAATNWEGYRRLASFGDLTIAGGESLYQPELLYTLAETGIGIIQPDLFRVGGITPVLEIIKRSGILGPRLTIHCGEEIAVIVSACFQELAMVEHMPTTSLHQVGLTETMLPVQEGMLVVPTALGHGVAFERHRLAQFKNLVV